MNYKTYKWNRALPNRVSKFEHYQSLEKLILSITEDVKTDIACTCCSSMVPIMFFFEGLARNRDSMPITGRYLHGTENNISFFVDPEAEPKTMTFETNGEIFAVIKDTLDF